MATETTTIHRSSLLQSEDWWAVWLGLFIFALGAGKIWNMDLKRKYTCDFEEYQNNT